MYPEKQGWERQNKPNEANSKQQKTTKNTQSEKKIRPRAGIDAAASMGFRMQLQTLPRSPSPPHYFQVARGGGEE